MTFPFQFRLEPGTRSTSPHAPCVRVWFKDESIALCDTVDAARDYVRTYGYMAEWRRQWIKGNRIGWNESFPPRTEYSS